jgi:hypothetical protein
VTTKADLLTMTDDIGPTNDEGDDVQPRTKTAPVERRKANKSQ